MNSKEKKTQRIMMLSGASRAARNSAAAMQIVDKTKQTKKNNLNEIPMAMKMNLLFSITSKLRAIRSSTPNQ